MCSPAHLAAFSLAIVAGVAVTLRAPTRLARLPRKVLRSRLATVWCACASRIQKFCHVNCNAYTWNLNCSAGRISRASMTGNTQLQAEYVHGT